MELKDYQVKALDTFDQWFEALRRQKAQSQKDAARYDLVGLEMPAEMRDFPKLAWQKLYETGVVKSKNYVARQDGAGRHIPHICFKVPTGGGKTLLAAEALGRIQRPRGLVLWIVPSRAIYQQTKDALWNREHPYRQRLESASGGRVKMLEKDDRLQPADLDNYLCVMLLMYPAANRRRSKEFLRFFRDSGRYTAFFPGSDDALFDGRLLRRYPDLDRGDGPIRQSLFNVIKMRQPVIILDEAHKAYGKKLAGARDFADAINRLNPRLVMEFSATPNQHISNLLVDITGLELKSEEMIKMPVQVVSQMKANWQDTLAAAAEELDKIDQAARSLHQQDNRYIRPIAVVRVERTGRDQRDGMRVHAEDAREFLLQNLGIPPEAIRVKSAQNDELGREDLLSEGSAVRWIITKAALMEGWDCPFAYLLVLLDNTRSQTALTQLVGRILRQPQARLTSSEALDRCYVYCWNLDVLRAVDQVRQGLQDEGLGDLAGQVESEEVEDARQESKPILRRAPFRGLPIRIPKVLHHSRAGWRELDHLQDILAEVDWDQVAPLAYQQAINEAAYWESAEVDVGGQRPSYSEPEALRIDKTLRIAWFARRLSDIVPNPWQAAEFAQGMIKLLRQNGLSDEEMFDGRAKFVDQLRSHLRDERDRLCKAIYEKKLATGQIKFDFFTEPNFAFREHEPFRWQKGDHTLEKPGGLPIQLSLFERVYESQFDSKLEKDFAYHLEKQPIKWWHRVKREYYVIGWRNEKIYPDFVTFADRHFGLFETKGAHLRNADTEYKRQVFELLQGHFNSAARQIRVRQRTPQQGQFEIVYANEFPSVSASV
ncbi:MAG: DEAD/DEAH box helicase family protein [Chloroflexi bacterium]|nr:DEAD/DEAH box helicase family protein [Chloroflexota bacterium]MCY3581962.1 DEAD/DEAH box helicase family protein [Chloroflexota bacterium]MCY3716398.1 DEAD/DEAH box helicase family protein [Chloroflexota bacterium]MDE2650901.1 DEAD/DEAH box helicase family protein [Chloroflexota bacterium]MYA94382.1 restriction endonuclease subunit R [Chloroflexota bacterium]